MVAHGLSFDALIRPRHLPHVYSFAARHPDLQIVIDHGAKPLISRKMLDPWRMDMRAARSLTAGLARDEEAALFHDAAHSFYRLG